MFWDDGFGGTGCCQGETAAQVDNPTLSLPETMVSNLSARTASCHDLFAIQYCHYFVA
jgi:hypothetical protein